MSPSLSASLLLLEPPAIVVGGVGIGLRPRPWQWMPVRRAKRTHRLTKHPPFLSSLSSHTQHNHRCNSATTTNKTHRRSPTCCFVCGPTPWVCVPQRHRDTHLTMSGPSSTTPPAHEAAEDRLRLPQLLFLPQPSPSPSSLPQIPEPPLSTQQRRQELSILVYVSEMKGEESMCVTYLLPHVLPFVRPSNHTPLP